jgi:putative PIN family toxin of toxin-antitoxin system
MGKKRVILDTNILISALGWKGNPKTIFNKVIAGELELILSYKQLNELLRVLNYPKFKFSDEQKDRFLSVLLEVATLVKTKSEVYIIKEDPSDNVILEPANEMKIDHIVSGNEHLLKLKEFKGAKIVTAKGFLEEV